MSTSARPTEQDALVMVDVQIDFCPGGALPVPEGDRVVPVLNRLIPLFKVIVASRDWHPPDHCSFREQGGQWPVHCVIGTQGAEYHPELNIEPVAIHLKKAATAERDSFDAFDAHDYDLAGELRSRGIERVFVGGLATEYCVLSTVLGALDAGFETYVIKDAMRAVNLQPADGERAKQRMREAGATLLDSSALSD